MRAVASFVQGVFFLHFLIFSVLYTSFKDLENQVCMFGMLLNISYGVVAFVFI